jgi:hypothetical protein
MFIEWFPTNLALLIKGTQELQKFQRLSIPRDTIGVMLISAIKTPLLLDPTLWDKVCLRLAAGQWFSLLTPPVSPLWGTTPPKGEWAFCHMYPML